MKLLLSLVTVLLLLAFPLSTHAHSGGFPFVKVNGKYPQETPLFLGLPNFDLKIPQDVLNTAYIVNQPITFEIEKANMQLPDNLADRLEFRWIWDKGTNALSEGVAVKHTYSKPGSYLVVLEAKQPSDTTYLVLNTIHVNVIPKEGYRLPTTQIQVKNPGNLTAPLRLSTKTSVDPSAKVVSYKWYLGTTGYSAQDAPEYLFPKDVYYENIFVEVTDSNGLRTYDGLGITNDKGQLAFNSLIPGMPVPVEGLKPSLPWWLIILASVGFTTLSGILVVQFTQRIRKSKTSSL